MELRERIMELGLQGFECSQILMILALEADGCENPDLVRAMSGLTGGLGHCRKECGALTGGCCVLGYYAGRGSAEEIEHNDFYRIVQDYVNWFQEEFSSGTNGTDCLSILGEDFSKAFTSCLPMLEACQETLTKILYENGVI